MKTMIRHITILMAVAMMALLGGGCAEVNETQQTVQPKGESEAIEFDVYTQRTKTRAGTAGDVTTDGLKDGTHSGFGVIAYYTGENSYDENIVPNFMYNQQVAYNSSKSVFDYSPIKYWPNEEDNDHISFFAYAPWVPVDATTGAATGDKTYGITGVSRNTFTGAPIVNYIATTDLSKGVDLCWGKELNKQNDGSKVDFTLSHSLAKLNVQVKSNIVLDANTKIYIRSISFSGFTMKGALNLNNTSSTTPLWLGYDGLGRLNKDAVTIYDGRRDGREGSLADANEGLTGLNPNLVQSTPWDDASPKPGVTNSAYNLFDNSSATTTPAYVIPTGDPVDVTIEYDIETKDDNLKGYYLSDGKTYGTSLANRITKTVVTDTEPRVPITLEAGKSYTLTLNLGIQDITFNAKSVSEWKSPDYDPINSPLTFEAITNTTISFSLISWARGKVKYSLDEGEDWIDYVPDNTPIYLNAGDKLSFKSEDANTNYGSSIHSHSQFNISGSCYVYGNILSLINNSTTIPSDNEFVGLFKDCSQMKNHEKKELVLPATDLHYTREAYAYMFKGCTGLTKAPALPATHLTSSCYSNMFEGCTGLTTAPTLPATELNELCYKEMFNGCTNLIVAPALPATTLKASCYWGMFRDCTSLTTAPTLPATEMEDNCYEAMFSGCTSMTVPPELPATTLASHCYSSMFARSGIVSAPVLNVTNLAQYCYSSMFYGCTGLTTAPALPATTLASNCYSGMFWGCTGLTTAPALPATTLASSCYSSMFYDCTNLTSAPELNATNLAQSCYADMFRNCTSLETAPTLPATVIDVSWYSCYARMFYECSSLNKIKCLATSIPNNSYTSDWVRHVAANGTFTKASSMTSWTTTGFNGIPYGWTVQNATP